MAREIPEVVRAAAGLAATVLDEARKLPETLPGLPVRVAGFAMQKALWLQQQYSGLVARGDELFTGIRGENEPGLATFDDDLPEPDLPAATGFRDSAFDRVSEEDLLSGLPEDDVAVPATAAEDDAVELAREALEELALADLVDDEELGLPSGADAEAVVASVEGIPAAPEVAPEAATAPDVVEATDESGTPVAAAEGSTAAAADTGSSAPATPPVDGYDDWSIAQLRGRLRGYEAVTVRELLAYEEANRAREPYLRMLRNRLEKAQPANA